MLQENNPDATCMSIPRVYLVSCCYTCDELYMSVSKLVTDYRAFVSRMTNRHGHWVWWMSMGGKSRFKHTQHSAA